MKSQNLLAFVTVDGFVAIFQNTNSWWIDAKLTASDEKQRQTTNRSFNITHWGHQLLLVRCVCQRYLKLTSLNITHAHARTVHPQVCAFCNLVRNSSYVRRYANPARRTRRFSIKPRYVTWCFTVISTNKSTETRQQSNNWVFNRLLVQLHHHHHHIMALYSKAEHYNRTATTNYYKVQNITQPMINSNTNQLLMLKKPLNHTVLFNLNWPDFLSSFGFIHLT